MNDKPSKERSNHALSQTITVERFNGIFNREDWRAIGGRVRGKRIKDNKINKARKAK